MEQSANWCRIRNNFACRLFSFKNILIFCFFSSMTCAVLTLTVFGVFAVCINLGHLKYFQCNVSIVIVFNSSASADAVQS